MRDLRYADDTALLSKSDNGLDSLITTVKEHSESRNLKLNVKKTKIMDVKGCSAPSIISVNGEHVENVESFEYLGSLIEADGDGSREIKRRLAMASRKLEDMKDLINKSSKAVKLRVSRTCFFPTATYGCETWTLSKNIEKRIVAFENKCYRKLLNVSWTERRTNESIWEELNVVSGSVLRFVRRQKLRYFGHIKRHDSLEKDILEGMIEGKRNRGHPKRRWEDDITELLGVSIATAGRLAQERDSFRSSIEAATSPSGG